MCRRKGAPLSTIGENLFRLEHRARISIRSLKMMAKSREWAPPDIDTLKGSRGVTELRWRSGRKPHRILGYRSGELEYTMLVGCTHDKKYDPRDALETAVRRKKQIEGGEAQAREYQLYTDERTKE